MREDAASLSVVIPAWNEEGGIGDALDQIAIECRRLTSLGEVAWAEMVVVDDGSTDATASVVAARADGDPPVRLVRHAANLGLGAALRSGFGAARGDLILYTDADLPFDPREIETALRIQRTYRADVVSMYRSDRTGEGPRRLVYSYGYNLLVQGLLALRVRDVNFAGKLIRRAALDGLDLRSEGSFIDVELLSRLDRSGSRIVQFAVDYFPRTRGGSTLSSLSVIGGMLAELVRLAPSIVRSGRPSWRR